MTEDLRTQLLTVLSKFSVDDIKNYALKEFSTISWLEITRFMQEFNLRLNPKNVAEAIVRIVFDNEPTENELKEKLDNLKLRAFGTAPKRTWFAYELIEADPDFNVPFKQFAACIGRTLNARTIAIRGPHDFDSILVSVTPKTRSTIVQLIGNYLFTSSQNNNIDFLKSIARAMGWQSIKNCKLSGAHIPSMLTLLHRRKGRTHNDGIKSSGTYESKPQRNKHGFSLITGDRMRNYLKRKLGDEEDAPLLRDLTLETITPFHGHEIYAKAVLSSGNIESSLRDMAMADIILPSSLFFGMLTEHGKTELKAKIK